MYGVNGMFSFNRLYLSLLAKRHHTIDGMRCEVKKALSKVEMEKAKQQRRLREFYNKTQKIIAMFNCVINIFS